MMNKLLLIVLLVAGFALKGIAVNPSNAIDCSSGEVQRAIDDCDPGGTVLLPTCDGTPGHPIGDWPTRVSISKSLKVIGGTTVTGAGLNQSNPLLDPGTTADDKTIVKDSVSGQSLLQIIVGSGEAVQFEGVTFQAGSSTKHDNAIVTLGGTGKVRIDKLHFIRPMKGRFFEIGSVTGVIDHNFIESVDTNAIHILNSNYSGVNDVSGHASWADFPWFGQDGHCLFIEDNTIVKNVVGTRGLTDGDHGMRVVVRYNYLRQFIVADHGTEGAPRGGRSFEVYHNTFNFLSSALWPIQLRSGVFLAHDNTVTGSPSNNDKLGVTRNYREECFRPPSAFGGCADGASIWDKNVTDVGSLAARYDKTQQSFVEGHQGNPYVFETGTATGGSTTTMVDNSTFRQNNPFPTALGGLVGYSISNYGGSTISNDPAGPYKYPTLPKDAHGDGGRIGSYITSNTPTSITFAANDGTPFGDNSTDVHPELQFSAGDTYKIHRIIQMLDGDGAGKTDLLSGGDTPVIKSSGVAGYSHSAWEPSIEWNNKYHPPTGPEVPLTIQRGAGDPTTAIGTSDVCPNGPDGLCTGINLGLNPPSTGGVPDKVRSIYVASRNGTGADYIGDFTYPHPCTTDFPTCAGTLSAPTAITPTSATAFVGQSTAITVFAVDGNPKPSLSPTPAPGATPSWATFTGGGAGSGQIVIGGTPPNTGGQPYHFSFVVTNNQGSVTKTFDLAVATPTPTPTATPTPSVTPTPTPTAIPASGITPNSDNATINQAYNRTVTAVASAGTPTPAPVFSPTATPGPIPSWASFNVATPGQVTITGTPPNATGAPFDFSFKVTNSAGSVVAPYHLTVSATPTPSPTPTQISIAP